MQVGIPGTAALITGTPTLIPGTATLISGTATLITGTATLIPGIATVIPGTRSIGDSYFQVFPRFRLNSCWFKICYLSDEVSLGMSSDRSFSFSLLFLVPFFLFKKSSCCIANDLSLLFLAFRMMFLSECLPIGCVFPFSLFFLVSFSYLKRQIVVWRTISPYYFLSCPSYRSPRWASFFPFSESMFCHWARLSIWFLSGIMSSVSVPDFTWSRQVFVQTLFILRGPSFSFIMVM